MLSGNVGIICNILLCIVKFTVGVLTGSVSITADAVNNLTDASVSIVTIAGTLLAEKPVDKEHPFGHGRAEYISALVVALSIFIMSFELGKNAVEKIIHPASVKFSVTYLVLLTAAALVKLWIAYFNKRLYSLTDNLNLKAVMKDSINDSLATLATIMVLVVAGKLHIYRIDGVIGLVVAVFVFFSGLSILKEILGPLLGQPPSKELCEQIEDIILENDLILGVHDLIVHDYGPGRIIASAHAEVPADIGLMEIHDVIDHAERKIKKTLKIDMCIHIDPVAIDDEEQEKYKTLTEIIVSDYNSDFTFHDFRLHHKKGKKIISFDLVTPFEYEEKKAEIENDFLKIYKTKFPDITLKIKIEHSFV